MGTVLKSVAIFSVATAITAGCGRTSKKSDDASPAPSGGPQAAAACPSANAAKCDDTRAKIADLSKQHDDALAKDDTATALRLGLEIEHQKAVLDLLAHDAPADKFAALDAQYAQVKNKLEAVLAAPTPSTGSQPGVPANNDLGYGLVKVGSLIYHQAELDAVTHTFKDFGDLYVGEETAEVKVDQIPWTGYWYPFSGDDLFHDENSPLGKLDQVLTKMSRIPDVAETERKFSPSHVDTWEGRCAGWAMASVMFKEPQAPVTFQDVSFSISDQKALMTKAVELHPSDFYGIRYDADDKTDGTLQDVRPEAFHRIFMGMLGERGKTFVIDDDPGVQIWSRPVHRVAYSIKKDPSIPNAFLVTAGTYEIVNREFVSDDLTTRDDTRQLQYDYRLYVDPTQVKDGKAKVIAGEWINQSAASHPDSITVPKDNMDLQSGNTELNKNMDVVKQILGISG